MFLPQSTKAVNGMFIHVLQFSTAGPCSSFAPQRQTDGGLQVIEGLLQLASVCTLDLRTIQFPLGCH